MTTYIEYTDWKTLKGYYLYGYLREEDDEYGGKGTMYYVGDTPNMKRWHYDNCTTLKV